MIKTYTKASANLSRLEVDIKSAIPSTINYLSSEGDQVYIHTNRNLTEAETIILDGIVANHSVTVDIAKKKIEAAMQFGNALLVEFATDNVMQGITQTGKTKAVADYCCDIMRYIQSGSLYETINEVDRLVSLGVPADLAPYVTAVRLNQFKQRILNFLG